MHWSRRGLDVAVLRRHGRRKSSLGLRSQNHRRLGFLDRRQRQLGLHLDGFQIRLGLRPRYVDLRQLKLDVRRPGLVDLGRLGQLRLLRGRFRFGDHQHRHLVLVLLDRPLGRRAHVEHQAQHQPVERHAGDKRAGRTLGLGEQPECGPAWGTLNAHYSNLVCVRREGA